MALTAVGGPEGAEGQASKAKVPKGSVVSLVLLGISLLEH